MYTHLTSQSTAHRANISSKSVIIIGGNESVHVYPHESSAKQRHSRTNPADLPDPTAPVVVPEVEETSQVSLRARE